MLSSARYSMYRYVSSICQGISTVHPKALKIPPPTTPGQTDRYASVPVKTLEPPGRGQSVYRYPLRLVHIVRTGWYTLKLRALLGTAQCQEWNHADNTT
ncbi:hypothetical protein BHM03_00013600 [Ensete ventricosum]|uniref:Uncharacterized protein n=1 Tax=Ensete ventricosum TaxID=4639 RepID=A0A445MDW2_ENSVE|nr:hypothetical protein BHM03_00013600 [Ensete ventricosum]